MLINKSLVQTKSALFSKVTMKENKKFFTTKASLNAFTSKIFKVKSFQQVEELERVFNYIKSNNLKYKNKDLKQYITQVQTIEDKYNKLIKQIEQLIKKNKKIKSNVIPFEKVGTIVNKWWNKTQPEAKRYRFVLRLKSGVADVEHSFKFNHINHFDNWFDKIKESKGVIKSESFGEVYDIEGDDFKNLFTDLCSIVKLDYIKGGCNKHKACDKKIKGCLYNFKLFNPSSQNNNCFFSVIEHILNKKLDIKQLRKQFNLPTNTEVSIDDAYKVIKYLKLNIQIIEPDFNDELDEDQKYILLNNNHYYYVQSFEMNQRKNKKTKRGLMTIDFETRKTEKYNLIKRTEQKCYILKDTICHAYYNKYKSQTKNSIKFTTNSSQSSSRQFINFLNSEAKNNRSYNIVAHNGGNFDYYFIISEMTEAELLECELQFRGITIIGINYRGNLFKDSCCFLADSLDNLCKSFKVENSKKKEFDFMGVKVSSSNLCFYKPELTFNQFLELEKHEPEYWALYNEYCLYDCISLYQIWEKFVECIEVLIKKINPKLIKSCNVNACNTIGSLSKKTIKKINPQPVNIITKYTDKRTGEQYIKEINENSKKKCLDDFLDIQCTKEGNNGSFYINRNKYDFVCNFKRGGISHCNQAGKHMSGITGVDIASQYPASLIHAKIPCGKSMFFEDKDEKYISKTGYKYGFYLLSDVKFNGKKLKPVALSLEGQSLNWATNEMNELYVDSFTFEYLKKHYGLYSYNIKKALLSKQYITGDKIFGSCVNTFYNEKKRQDKLKTEKKPEYNEALRSTIKLFLNSMTGKLVENPSIHFSTLFNNNSETKLNGVGFEKILNDDKINDWIIPGVMVYSYSKRLLFEYIHCLPNGSDDVIHIETDGIYFSSTLKDKFIENVNNYKGEYPVKMGEDLGNLKIEKSTNPGQVAYFLGKKFYCITTNNEPIMRIKGIPQKTIDKHGNIKPVVDIQLYEDVYNGLTVPKKFYTLKKHLFTQKTCISQLKMKRLVKPQGEYKLF